MTVSSLLTTPSLLDTQKTLTALLTATLTLLSTLTELTTTSSPTTLASQKSTSRSQKRLLVTLGRLRAQIRRASYLVRSEKTETANARVEVDRLLLQLQNLYYEQRHLLGEIEACEGFEHVYLELPLMDETEFLEMYHPEMLRKMEEKEDGLDNNDEMDAEDQDEKHVYNEETIMAERIRYEGAERERMELERKELEARKAELVKENTRRKEKIKGLDERLEKYLEGCGELSQELEGEL